MERSWRSQMLRCFFQASGPFPGIPASVSPSAAERPESFHNVRRQAGERQEPADIGVRDALLLRKIGDRLGLTALDPLPPAIRSNQRLD
jgi:hypothetical protein